MIITHKQAFLKKIRELEADNQQYHFALTYALFDLEATRRERDEAREELELLRESLLDDFGEDGSI